MPKSPNQDTQIKAVKLVKDTFTDYKDLLDGYHQRLIKIYEAFSTYDTKKNNPYDTDFKVNKAHEVIEKILPRLIAKDPRWVVTPATNDFHPDLPLPAIPAPNPMLSQEQQDMQRQMALQKRQEEIERRQKEAVEFSRGVQDYLAYAWDEYGYTSRARIAAKKLISYGKVFAKIKSKYEIVRRYKKREDPVEGEEPMMVEEEVAGYRPDIDVKSWTQIYYDPQYRSVEDMPALIEAMTSVRMWEIKRNKKDFFNVDKLEELTKIDTQNGVDDNYLSQIREISGIQNLERATPIDRNNLNIKIYYGYFAESEDSDEQLYEMWVVEDMVLIKMKPILRIPFVCADCFEDLETANSVGFVEPIIGLQNELNFKKNAASTYINNALYDSWVWSPNSGIDPRTLVRKPNNIIVTTRSVQEAMANLQQLQYAQLDPTYFQEQNDFERQIQGMTFTVDTANPKSQQAMTNTATGIRVKFFESNAVIDEIRKHFEQFLTRLAYHILQEAFDNMEDNIMVKKMGEEDFWEMNKELLRDAVTRYTIKVEVNSSSFNDLENRREDAMAWFNIMLQAQQLGFPVNFDEVLKDVAFTFEKKDINRYVQPPDISQIVQQTMGMPQGTPQQLQAPQERTYPPAQLTQQVAGGEILPPIP